ncbi:hypothetical protein MMC25_002226 [Agyrium rufum]|nr:hypothetical protein [Agyrium rufum]
MSFIYKHVLLIGATSGIGRGMADRFIKEGIKVTAVSRRKDKLDQFVNQHGEEKAKSIVFDISRTDATSQFAADTLEASPDIDCLFLNAGKQGHYDLSKPASIDLATFNAEVHLNFTSLVALTHAFLPHLQAKGSLTSIVITGTNIAIVPAFMVPAYSASKAALNAYMFCLREALTGSNVKVIDISPPAVQTELHDYIGEERGRAIGMPLKDFVEVAYKGLAAGSDQIIVGSIGPEDHFNDIITKRRAAFDGLSKMMRGAF